MAGMFDALSFADAAMFLTRPLTPPLSVELVSLVALVELKPEF